MADIILGEDPVARAITYLKQYLAPGDATAGPHITVPDGWAWDKLLIVVADTGGPGERDVVLDDAFLTVEVSAPDSVRASEVARRVHGLLKQWPYAQPGVHFRRTIQRPTFQPDDETRTPAYSMTVELTFRSTAEQFTSL